MEGCAQDWGRRLWRDLPGAQRRHQRGRGNQGQDQLSFLLKNGRQFCATVERIVTKKQVLKLEVGVIKKVQVSESSRVLFSPSPLSWEYVVPFIKWESKKPTSKFHSHV